MKFLCFLFLLVFGPLFAQNAGSTLLYTDTDEFTTQPNGLYNAIIDNFFAYSIYRNPDGSKTFVFSVVKCLEALPGASLGAVFLQGSLLHVEYGMNCKPFSQSAALTLAPVQEAIGDFLNDSSDVPHHIVYKLSSLPGTDPAKAKPRTAPAQPATAANPQMIILDNISDSRILKVDLTSFAIVNPVTLPGQPAAFAVRPSDTGAANEVWTAHAVGTGNTISIADLGAGKLLATIQTSSLAPNTNIPAGIVFTNDGATALCGASYFTADASGNRGALLVYDAVNRKLTSTLPLKFSPQQLLMAPDGLTAYIIGSQSGTIAYYDVLSGTADLTVTRIPSFTGQVFIHPDGTRLFWDAGQLEVFDLTTRKIVNEFKFGLPTTSATSMQMSQDGSKVYVGNGLGAVVILDTRYGNALGTFQSPGPAQVFGGPEAN
jgi:hypothetical protein